MMTQLVEIKEGEGLKIRLGAYPDDALDFTYEQLREAVLDAALVKLRRKQAERRAYGQPYSDVEEAEKYRQRYSSNLQAAAEHVQWPLRGFNP